MTINLGEVRLKIQSCARRGAFSRRSQTLVVGQKNMASSEPTSVATHSAHRATEEAIRHWALGSAEYPLKGGALIQIYSEVAVEQLMLLLWTMCAMFSIAVECVRERSSLTSLLSTVSAVSLLCRIGLKPRQKSRKSEYLDASLTQQYGKDLWIPVPPPGAMAVAEVRELSHRSDWGRGPLCEPAEQRIALT